MNKRFGVWAVVCGFFLGFGGGPTFAAMYNYQTYPGNGSDGAVGNGSLIMSNNATTVYGKIVKGTGSFTDNLVMFIDSVPGGFTDTSRFYDNNGFREIAVSGNGTSKSTAYFAPGFEADYAIVLSIAHNSSALYKLTNGVSGPDLLSVTGVTLQNVNNPNDPSFAFQFDWASIGLPSLRTNFFKFETTYVSDLGYRTLQSYEGLTGKEGFDVITFTNYDTYGVQPVPENTNAALAVFSGLVCSVTCFTRLRRPYRRPPIT